MEQHFPSGKGPFSNADKRARRKHKRECRRVRLVDIARRKKGGNRNSPATAQRFLLGAALGQAQKPRSDPSVSSNRSVWEAKKRKPKMTPVVFFLCIAIKKKVRGEWRDHSNSCTCYPLCKGLVVCAEQCSF